MYRMVPWLILAGILTSPATAAEVSGPATVTDGDTLRIGESRIRLFGIDAPENKQSCERDGAPWLCGQEAAKLLREIVAGKDLRCVQYDRDRYKRSVSVCTLPDGQDINAAMVLAGMAVAFTQYAGPLYKAQEAEAKASKRGLWAGTFVMPWEYRRR